METISVDIAVIGGGLGGCAAALGAARLGYRVALTEETHWIGGQLTSQAVPPDEHPWIEEFGASASYRALREGIRRYYRDYLPLTGAARAVRCLNPGNGWVSRLCHDPRVAVAVLGQMLAPYELSGKLLAMRSHREVAALNDGDRIAGVVVRRMESGQDILIEAPYFIDATPLGELLSLAGVEHVVGAESQAETAEPHAAEAADPMRQQGITVCFAMEYLPGEDHTIDKPRHYDLWRGHEPPGWPGRLFGWTTSQPETHAPLTRLLFEAKDGRPWWNYRRILDATNFETGFAASDISLVNWPQNDYWLSPVCGVDAAEREQNLASARQLSLSLLQSARHKPAVRQQFARRSCADTAHQQLCYCPDDPERRHRHLRFGQLGALRLELQDYQRRGNRRMVVVEYLLPRQFRYSDVGSALFHHRPGVSLRLLGRHAAEL